MIFQQIKHIFTGLCLVCLCTIGIVQAQDPGPKEIKEAVMVFSQPEIYQQLDSPDENFMAELTIYPCVEISGQETSYEQMNLIDARTGEVQEIAEQLINCGGLGAFGLYAMHWSDDSNYLYYTDAREGSPDGFVMAWSPTIWRFQIADSQSENLGQAQFSPDGKWLATKRQNELKLLSVNSDEVMHFELTPSGLQLSQLIWLPDSNGIIYIQADILFGTVSRNTVTHLDLKTGTQTVLLDKETATEE